MTWFIDRRLNGKNKSAVNRQRFLRRYQMLPTEQNRPVKECVKLIHGLTVEEITG